MHCKNASNHFVLVTLPPTSRDNQKCLQTLPSAPGGQNLPKLRTTATENSTENSGERTELTQGVQDSKQIKFNEPKL